MNKSTLPKWFFPMCIFGLLWNVMGIFNFISQMTITPAYLAQLPSAEQALLESIPMASDVAFAIGVFGGTFGCIGLLLCKRWSAYLLLSSLVAVMLQMGYWLFFTEAVLVYGSNTYILPMLVILIAFLLFRISSKGVQKGYLT